MRRCFPKQRQMRRRRVRNTSKQPGAAPIVQLLKAISSVETKKLRGLSLLHQQRHTLVGLVGLVRLTQSSAKEAGLLRVTRWLVGFFHSRAEQVSLLFILIWRFLGFWGIYRIY